jgi:hypothetical protein
VSVGEVLVTAGIILNIANFGYHIYSAETQFARGNYQAGAEAEAWAMADLIMLALPGSGMIGPSARLAGASATTASTMLKAGLKASAAWGYLSAMVSAGEMAGGGEFSPEPSGPSGGEPGQWQSENQGGWPSMTADVYQAQITGRHGMCYVVKGVRFDGWDSARRVLLGAKDNYAFLLKGGKWQPWFNPDTWANIAQREFEAAGNIPIEWHFAQKEVADAVRPLVSGKVTVVYTPSGL